VSTENQVSTTASVAVSVTVSVNGERRSFPAQTTLLDVVRSLQLEPERVAVELDRAIVKRERWTATTIANGAEIEIVQFVGGG
jgi:thiamine biosynthesis protein ThiS